ncbi:hypothetical protein NE237_010339 [Protea cynaroides]|uniref:SUN domain-containing protein n=1 Tax=Protea cynaroides TaxID=273540 RepID=A0A9Q0R1H0_9MAGN|nr:hypothetical protein NE237_010339 [Protea cynaroides]
MAAGIITKKDFERLLDELKKSRSPEEGDKDWSLDTIRSLARDIVSNEIEKHVADGLGRVDYALASGGGMVRCAEDVAAKFWRAWAVFSSIWNQWVDCDEAESCNCAGGHYSGTCCQDCCLRQVSAPKDCWVSAWLQKKHDSDPSVKPEMFLLTEFTYDLEKSNAQTIDVDSMSSGPINMVRFYFASNHGNPSHTCIYRLRVHGYEPKSVALFATQSLLPKKTQSRECTENHHYSSFHDFEYPCLIVLIYLYRL